MKSEVCRVLADIAGRGELIYSWMTSRQLAEAAVEYVANLLANSSESMVPVTLTIQCVMSYVI